jgi:hypothetical protein
MIRDLISKCNLKEEDKLYLDQPHIWQNLRKWVTLLDFSNPSDTSKHEFTAVGRKGLNKIYNLHVDYVDRATRYNAKPSKYDPPNHFSTKNLILAAAKKCLLKGHKIEVVK